MFECLSCTLVVEWLLSVVGLCVFLFVWSCVWGSVFVCVLRCVLCFYLRVLVFCWLAGPVVDCLVVCVCVFVWLFVCLCVCLIGRASVLLCGCVCMVLRVCGWLRANWSCFLMMVFVRVCVFGERPFVG